MSEGSLSPDIDDATEQAELLKLSQKYGAHSHDGERQAECFVCQAITNFERGQDSVQEQKMDIAQERNRDHAVDTQV